METNTGELFQYIRKGQKIRFNKILNRNELVDRGKPIGMMYAFPIKGTNIIGIAFTRFHSKKEQYWDESFGKNLAINRAIEYHDIIYIPKFAQKIPKYVKRQFKKFINRSRRYFKSYQMPEWVVKFENDIKNPMFLDKPRQRIREKTENVLS